MGSHILNGGLDSQRASSENPHPLEQRTQLFSTNMASVNARLHHQLSSSSQGSGKGSAASNPTVLSNQGLQVIRRHNFLAQEPENAQVNESLNLVSGMKQMLSNLDKARSAARMQSSYDFQD